ncbi:hypothetical protein YC2023_067383 [Brassica napus]
MLVPLEISSFAGGGSWAETGVRLEFLVTQRGRCSGIGGWGRLFGRLFRSGSVRIPVLHVILFSRWRGSEARDLSLRGCCPVPSRVVSGGSHFGACFCRLVSDEKSSMAWARDFHVGLSACSPLVSAVPLSARAGFPRGETARVSPVPVITAVLHRLCSSSVSSRSVSLVLRDCPCRAVRHRLVIRLGCVSDYHGLNTSSQH